MRARTFLPSPGSARPSASSSSFDADGHEHAVDRLLGAVFLELLEERDPLVAVVGLGRVAAGGVEEDRLVREPPVAVARAADAADAAAVAGSR
jgi:hypothetical protein